MLHRYSNLPNYRNEELSRKYVTNPIYPYIGPTEEDTYLISTDGDRYDLLAFTFYNDPKLWWIIASANNATTDNLAIQPGLQIRIPAFAEQAVAKFLEFNDLR